MATLSVPASLEQLANVNAFIHETIPSSYWGAPFDPFLEAPVPDVSLGVDERPVGGLGIHLIKSVVAHYTYAYYEQSNIIELYFALPE